MKHEKKFDDFLALHSRKAELTGKPTTPYILPRTFRPLVMLQAVRFKKPLDRFCDSYAEPNSIRVLHISIRNLYKIYEDLGSTYDLLCTRFSTDHDNNYYTHFQFFDSEDKKAAMKELYQSGFLIAGAGNVWEACMCDQLSTCCNCDRWAEMYSMGGNTVKTSMYIYTL